MSKDSVFYLLVAIVLTFLLAPKGHTESASKLKAGEEDIREQMLQITKELGTTCTECHSVGNFKDGSKNSFKVAAKHIEIVAMLKQKGFNGKDGPEASCYMCHRGTMKPAYEMKEAH